MQSAEVYLELLHERGRKGLLVERIYRQLFNPIWYLTAYGKIYRNAGALTPGVTAETVDGMSLAKINDIIEALRFERYHWKPARRAYISKKDGRLRPLGMPSWSDKLLAEVIRMFLEAYFEPTFSDHSHGFRPGRGCHTTLREIYYGWSATTWFLEGDISGCFEHLDHELLLVALSKHFHDGRFLQLIRGLLNAGYLEDWTFHRTWSGVPQGSVVSPILSNILLDRLDKYIEEVLIPRYTKGAGRRRNPAYRQLDERMRHTFKKGDITTALALKRELQMLPTGDQQDPNFRRLRYTRYADDWLIGFIGPKAEMETIKRDLEAFLRDELKLELSRTKTLITHARTGAARFLGYEIATLQNDQKRHPGGGRSLNGHIGLRVPQDVLDEKCNRYRKDEKRDGKIMHRRELVDDSPFTILSIYQREYQGIVEYYRLAYNLHRLDYLKWVMEQSLTKTLAQKFKISMQKVCDRYKAEWEAHGTTVRGFHVIVPREDKAPLVARWGGVSLKWDIKANLTDQHPRVIAGRTELEKRLLAQVCELCGATRDMDLIEVHHIRALKDLNHYTGRDRPDWVERMAGRRRKTIVLCRTCHLDIQHGRPTRRQSKGLEMSKISRT